MARGSKEAASEGASVSAMLRYASRTGTRRNLDALRGAGWRLMISATGVHRSEGFAYAIDNGAWTAFQKKEPWNRDAFERLVDSHGEAADFIVVPDIVMGGIHSLRFSESWLLRLSRVGPRLLIAVQDGMVNQDIRPLLDVGTGIFVGGSTDWKLLTMGRWADLARECGSYCHVGRVNSRIRIRMCARFGVDSFDGSSVSRFAKNLAGLEEAAAFWSAQTSLL